MKSAKPFFFIFGFVGLLSVIVGSVMASKSAALLHNGLTAVGTVTEVTESRHTDKKGKSSRTFRSTISYTPREGAPTTFVQGGDYGKGQQVSVLYLPGDPASARVNSFGSIWGGTAAFTCIGLVFALVGFVGVLSILRRERTIAQLKETGQRVSATVIGVDRHSSRSSKRGRRTTSYRLLVRADVPVPGLPTELCSDYLPREPDLSIVGTSVEVLYDAQNPCSYYVNLE